MKSSEFVYEGENLNMFSLLSKPMKSCKQYIIVYVYYQVSISTSKL